MKILIIYKYLANHNHDEYLHLDFAKSFEKYGHEINFYGPDVEHLYPENCKIKYKENIFINDIKKVFDYDAIICLTKSRMFLEYSPPTRGNYMKGCILPLGLHRENCPKIVLEEDYHYEINDDWYFEKGFNAIFQRHLTNVKDGKVKNYWVPFSVDVDKFKYNLNNRINKICFAGSISPPYPDRIYACAELNNNKLIDIFSSRQKVGDSYVECLQKYIAHLSGSSSYMICCAKNFEIMSCGSLLFTNNFPGLSFLFPKDTYKIWNEHNLIDEARFILNNPEYVKETTKKALTTILEKHTHEIRISEIIKLMKEL